MIIISLQETATPHFILCLVEEGAKPVRDPNSDVGKWFLTKEEFSGDEFPPFCSGTAYVTNVATMKLVLEAARSDPLSGS